MNKTSTVKDETEQSLQNTGTFLAYKSRVAPAIQPTSLPFTRTAMRSIPPAREAPSLY